jgi:CRP/FNR family cyclic AMP-dependent transcriptional regulator
MARSVETLARLPLFSSLSASAIKDLDSKCSWRHSKAKEWIIDYQDDGIDVFFVAAGSVRILIYAKSGREVILADLNSGGFFGELAAIDGKSRSAGVLAVTDVIIAAMPGPVFMNTLRTYPDIAIRVLKLLAARVRVLDNRVLEYSTLNVKQRVYSELLRLGKPDTKDHRQAILSPPPIQSEIAARVSTHREAVVREMKSLEREGLLRRRRGALVLTDVPKLIQRLEKHE